MNGDSGWWTVRDPNRRPVAKFLDEAEADRYATGRSATAPGAWTVAQPTTAGEDAPAASTGDRHRGEPTPSRPVIAELPGRVVLAPHRSDPCIQIDLDGDRGMLLLEEGSGLGLGDDVEILVCKAAPTSTASDAASASHTTDLDEEDRRPFDQATWCDVCRTSHFSACPVWGDT